MEIDINQKKISLGDKYQIYTDGAQTHVASRQIFQFLPEINLFKIGEDRARMTINKRLSFLKAKYDITRWDNNILNFRTVSFWKPYYHCQFGNDNYEIYGHLGRKYSIYKNSLQVAWWNKNAVAWFAGDNYKIIEDRNSDVDLIISFCLTVDNYSNDNHDGNLVNIDLGNFMQAKEFNEHWWPK